METLDKLRKKNPHLKIYDIHSEEFKKFGRVSDLDCSEMIRYMEENTEIPQEGHYYIPDDEKMHNFSLYQKAKEENYGLMDIELGYCNGHSNYLNGLEYHKTNEFNIAVTDMVIFLGMVKDIQEGKFDTSHAKAFFVAKGEVVELYQTSMHYAPVEVYKSGFKCGVILQKGTNEITGIVDQNATGEKRMLFKKNTWLMVHPDYEEFVALGAYPGICGENFKIDPLD